MKDRRRVLIEAIQGKLKLNRLKMIRENIKRQINEVYGGDPYYPSGADTDANAPYNKEELSPKIGFISGPFEGIAQSADINILKDKSGSLYVMSTDALSQEEIDAIYIDYVGVPTDEEGDYMLNSIDRSSRDIPLDAVSSYINTKFKSGDLKIGSGYADWDSYSDDIIEMDERMKEETSKDYPDLKAYLQS